MNFSKHVRGLGLVIVVGALGLSFSSGFCKQHDPYEALYQEGIDTLTKTKSIEHTCEECSNDEGCAKEIEHIEKRLRAIEQRACTINNIVTCDGAFCSHETTEKTSRSKLILRATQDLMLYIIQTVRMIIQLSCAIAQVYLLVKLYEILIGLKVTQEMSGIVNTIAAYLPWLGKLVAASVI